MANLDISNGNDPDILNMRIRFWGVQGSCPLFPEPHEVREYRWAVAQDAVSRTIEYLREKARVGRGEVDRILAGLYAEEDVATFHRALGQSDMPVYGGETTCVIIETSDGHVIVLDGGSGIRNGSKHMIRNWGDRPRTLHILASHEHLDHRSGLPFCQFCFARPPFEIHLHGSRQFLSALDQRYGIFSRKITPATYYDDPIDYRMMSAKFSGYEIPGHDDDPAEINPWAQHETNKPIQIGKTRITPFDVYHGATRSVAFRIDHAGVSFVFCTDHEFRRGAMADDPRQLRSHEAEARLRAHCSGVDLAYFDGQYFLDEYEGKRGIGVTAAVPRVDWGHGCIEDALDRSAKCRIKRTLIGHHDPERPWQERLALDQKLFAETAAKEFKIELARSDLVVDL